MARSKGGEEILPFLATKLRVSRSGGNRSGGEMALHGIEKFVSSERFMEKAVST